ncbi:MAG TPA: hemerythrin domain-containing protein [Bacillota bacterium]|nr:hemerythrin domain-containing protein [Bacillota bacterium]
MTGGYVNIIFILLKAHQEIKAVILDTQKVIESIGDKLNSVSYEVLIPNMDKITNLVINHFKKEEQEIIPLLQQMYNPKVEIAQYVKDEHMYIEKELDYLLSSLSSLRHISMDVNSNTVSRLQGVFEEMMVHFFEEENGLYPLVQGYITSTKEKTP